MRRAMYYLFPGSGDRGPSRFGLGVLLNPHNCVSVKEERDLSKMFCFAAGDGITLRTQLYHVGFIHEGLAQHGD